MLLKEEVLDSRVIGLGGMIMSIEMTVKMSFQEKIFLLQKRLWPLLVCHLHLVQSACLKNIEDTIITNVHY